MNDDFKRIKELSNINFFKMLKLVELELNNWWIASSILAIAYDNLTEAQKERIRKAYEEKFGELPDVESFLEFGRKRPKFKESFFLPYENHVRNHESDSKLIHPDPDCIICKLFEEADIDS